jgi:hypothetical protein
MEIELTRYLRWMCLISVMVLNGHLYLSGEWLGLVLLQDIKRHGLKRYWTMCSKFMNHSRRNNPHDWKGRI